MSRNRRFDGFQEPLSPPPGQPLGIPEGHVGPYILVSGRMIYWTGRVAIGLRHQPHRRVDQPMSKGAVWVQNVMLRSRSPSPAWSVA
jgi:hypothetical protein